MSLKLKVLFVALFLVGLATVLTLLIHGHTIAILQPRGLIAEQERNLLFFASGLMLFVAFPVFILTFAIAWRYRDGNRQATYTPDWDGNLIAEIVWWALPCIIIAILAVVTWKSTHQLDPYKPLVSTAKPLTVEVVALQWKWLFIYPEQRIASLNYVQFPAGTPVNFVITADAPMNSFWIPQLGGQIYAMPGMTTQLSLMADQPGSFRGLSANLSGVGFSGMTFTAKSSSQAAFNQWVASLQHSPQTLSQSVYNQLAAPSSDLPVAYYTATDTGLYNAIIMKFMSPEQDPGMTSNQAMGNMAM